MFIFMSSAKVYSKMAFESTLVFCEIIRRLRLILAHRYFYSMRFALSHQPTVHQEFGCYGFESHDSYEGFEGLDGFERLRGMYFGWLCGLVALNGFAAPILRYFGGFEGVLGSFLQVLEVWGTIL